MSPSRVTRSFVAVGGLCAVTLGAFLLFGAGYYATPLPDRPVHPLHELLRPSGYIGLSLGVLGSALMLLNLSYLLRKSLQWIQFGTLRTWMGFHVVTGLVGPLAILVHTSIHPTSSLGILAFSAMVIVVCAGLIGRYIYAWVPRSPRGRELERAELESQLARREQELSELGTSVRALLRDMTSTDGRRGSTSITATLGSILSGDQAARREFTRLKREVLASPSLRPRAKEILPPLRRLCRERQWLARYEEARSLMGSWRFLHRWLAVLMLLLAAFHVAVAVRFGDLWMLGGSHP
ncbi:MAG: hypothetical protein AB7O52_10065 [Planctomycetota bacterium]